MLWGPGLPWLSRGGNAVVGNRGDRPSSTDDRPMSHPVFVILAKAGFMPTDGFHACERFKKRVELDRRKASFDFAQDEETFVMPSTIFPHPERSEA